MMTGSNLQIATFGNGCFWCSEAVFQRLKGVYNIKPGFMGGHIKNPAYREVVTGKTGHVEVVQLEFDPEKISYGELLAVFFSTHDPTTLNRQGNDVGTQYRSVVFYHSKTQQEKALAVKEAVNVDYFDGKVVTEIVPASDFYPAEKEHWNYFQENPENLYCQAVINPKLKKLKAVFTDKLK